MGVNLPTIWGHNSRIQLGAQKGALETSVGTFTVCGSYNCEKDIITISVTVYGEFV